MGKNAEEYFKCQGEILGCLELPQKKMLNERESRENSGIKKDTRKKNRKIRNRLKKIMKMLEKILNPLRRLLNE